MTIADDYALITDCKNVKKKILIEWTKFLQWVQKIWNKFIQEEKKKAQFLRFKKFFLNVSFNWDTNFMYSSYVFKNTYCRQEKGWSVAATNLVHTCRIKIDVKYEE